MKKLASYKIVAILNALAVLFTYVFPLTSSKKNLFDLAIEAWLITAVLLLPSLVLWIKKPTGIWVYSYLVLVFGVLTFGVLSGDVISAGLVLMVLAVPLAIIYSILVFTNVIK